MSNNLKSKVIRADMAQKCCNEAVDRCALIAEKVAADLDTLWWDQAGNALGLVTKPMIDFARAALIKAGKMMLIDGRQACEKCSNSQTLPQTNPRIKSKRVGRHRVSRAYD